MHINSINKNKKIGLKSIFTILISTIFTFGIFAPFEIYLSSKDDFFFDGDDLVPYCAIVSLFLFILILFTILLLNSILPYFIRIFLYLTSSITIAAYIEGTYNLTNYGYLDGTSINWADYAHAGFISNLAFGIILISLFLLFYKYQYGDKLLFIVNICLVLIELSTICILGINKGFHKEPQAICTDYLEKDLSTDQNILVIIMDTFDGQALSIMIDEDESLFQSTLKDFTFYKNTICAYQHTDYAVPQIVTGNNADFTCTYGEFIDSAYSNSVILDDLDKNGWQIGIYTDTLISPKQLPYSIDNVIVSTIGVSSHWRLLHYIYSLVGFRYSPHSFKHFFWFYSDDINELKCLDDDSNNSIFSWSNDKFFDAVNQIEPSCSDPVFRVIHIEGTHLPFYTDRNLNYVGYEVGINEEIMGMMKIIDALKKRLQDIGVYDNTSIIIMADHGHYDLHQNAALIIKEANSNHNFTVSQDSISYFNIPIIITALSHNENLSTIIPSIANSNKKRSFWAYDNWGLTSSEYPEGVIEHVFD